MGEYEVPEKPSPLAEEVKKIILDTVLFEPDSPETWRKLKMALAHRLKDFPPTGYTVDDVSHNPVSPDGGTEIVVGLSTKGVGPLCWCGDDPPKAIFSFKIRDAGVDLNSFTEEVL